MKYVFLKWILVVFAFLSMTISAQAAETYTLDPLHSYVLWHANHFGFSSLSGKWLVNGAVTLDKEHPEKSTVNVTISLATVETGIPELNKHLKGELFFDVAKYPTATFVSDKVMLGKNDTAKVNGTFTLRGITKPITLNVKLNKVGMNPVTDKLTAGFTAYTTLKRSDFGMTSLLPGVSDEVKIEIEAEAAKNK